MNTFVILVQWKTFKKYFFHHYFHITFEFISVIDLLHNISWLPVRCCKSPSISCHEIQTNLTPIKNVLTKHSYDRSYRCVINIHGLMACCTKSIPNTLLRHHTSVSLLCHRFVWSHAFHKAVSHILFLRRQEWGLKYWREVERDVRCSSIWFR